MNSGRYVVTQVLDLIHRQALDRLAERYNIRARHFAFDARSHGPRYGVSGGISISLRPPRRILKV